MSVLDKFFGHSQAEETQHIVEIPVLLRFWEEDGVWNGEAVDLPVAVFGNTFEDATKHLQEAVISHLETLQEVGTLKETIDMLRSCSMRHHLTVNEMGTNQPFMKFSAGLQDRHVVCIA